MEQQLMPVEMNATALECYRPLVRVKKYIDANYGREITLDKAARVAAMEKSYFSAFFRRKVGISFSDWLRRVRVKKAMSMFAEADCSIAEVASSVGFSDATTFGRAFKKVTLLTPRQYRNRVCPAIEAPRAE